MKKGYSKIYVKHVCGHTMMADSSKENVCKCGYKFTVKEETGTISAYQTQPILPEHLKFPERIKVVGWRRPNGEHGMRPAGCELSNFNFNIGRVTKKLLKDIESLGASVSTSNLKIKCLDGRTRTSHITISLHHKRSTQECWIDLVCAFLYKRPNNKIINERLRDFIEDAKRIKAGEKPEKYGDSRKVVIETAMEYSY